MDQRPQPRAERRRLSHMDRAGRPRMVDVTDKPVTARRAVAEAAVAVSPETMSLVIDGGGTKGDVLGVAELAGVMGAKRTSDLIPLCHPLGLTDLVVAITPDRAAGLLRIRAEAATTGQTGVEMEAMTAASIAALTVYDMVKGVERGVEIRGVRLVSKTGGKSGTWVRQGPPADAAPAPPEAETGRSRRRSSGVEAQGPRVSDSRTGARRSSSPPATARRPARARTPRAPASRNGSKALGFTVERRLVPDERWEIEAALVDGAGRPPADRHDRRHGSDAARRDPAGDPGRHRLRGPGSRRGDARGRPRPHAARRPVARRRRRARPDPHRQPARQPEGRARIARGDRRRCWITPSTPSRDRTITRSRPSRPTTEAPTADVPAVPGRSGLPARLPRLLGLGGVLRPRHGPAPACLRGRAAVTAVREHPGTLRRPGRVRLRPDQDVQGSRAPR